MEIHVKKTALILIIPLVIAACSEQQTSIDTNIEVPVSVTELELSSIEEFVTTTGTAIAIKDYTVASESAGYYRLSDNPRTGKPFMIGDSVRKDDVIVYIDNPEQENSIKIESQKLNLDISQSEYEKQQSLYEKGGVTLRELKNAEVSFIDAKYSYENALISLSKLKVVAPFDGIIVDIPYYTNGVRIDSGTEIVTVMDYRELYLEVNIPGKMMGKVVLGQPVSISNYTVPDKVLSGSITQVSPALNSETRTFKATVVVKNADLLLRPGMFVKADIIVDRSDNTIVVPKDIVIARRNGQSVFVVESGFARERRITPGLENVDYLEVTEGLEEGERVVVEGFETLSQGSKVTIVQ